MQNLIKCIKYFSFFSLANLADEIIGNSLAASEDSKLESNFDRAFKWRHFQNGFEEAKITRKPIFLFVHKPLCPACQKLKEKCSKSVRLMALSDWFVMIKLDQEKHGYLKLKEQELEPDGRYVPRILFFTADGNLIKDAYNKHEKADKEHKYFYGSPSHIVETLLFVLREYCEKPTSVIFDHEQSKLDDWDTENEILAPTLLS